jgi:hypothetical protein
MHTSEYALPIFTRITTNDDGDKMSRLIAHEHMQIPADVADAYIMKCLTALGSSGELGLPFRLHLRMPTGDFGLAGGVAIEKDVTAYVTYQLDATHRNRIVSIAWQSEDGGPFPKFQGTIETIEDESGPGTILVLAGAYDPPGGVAGVLFDASIGFWIARATARDLVTQLRDGAEHAYNVRDVVSVPNLLTTS